MRQEEVKEGDLLSVKDCMFTRKGETGHVLSVHPHGVALDFLVDCFGEYEGPSIELWEWHELELDVC